MLINHTNPVKKERFVLYVAVFLITAVMLTGCNDEPALQEESEAGGTTTSATSTPSTTTSTSAPAATTTEPTTSPTSSESSSNSEEITKEQATEITKDVLIRTGAIYAAITYPSVFMELDEAQTIPGGPDYYWLITDERFKNIADLRTYIETACTPAYTDKNFGSMLTGDTEYREYNNRVYADSRLGGRSSLAEHVWDSLRISSQDKDTLIVKVDETINDEIYDTMTYIMKKEGNIWRLDDESMEYMEAKE